MSTKNNSKLRSGEPEKPRKLRLSREALRDLTGRDKAAEVKGGAPGRTLACVTGTCTCATKVTVP